jgi:CRISPR-associated protein Csx16
MATLWIVSRHAGAVQWIKAQGWNGKQIDHLDIDYIQAGDTVMGTLPANLAAEVCAKEAHYIHLSLRIPLELRGVELTPEQMMIYGADLRAYDIREQPFKPEMLAAYSTSINLDSGENT